MAERRKHLRTPIKSPVYGNIKFISELQDISINGCFVKTKIQLPRGTLFEMEFTLPNTARIIHTTGEICWYGEYTSNKQINPEIGAGIRFVDMAVEDAESIKDFIKWSAVNTRKFKRFEKNLAVSYFCEPDKKQHRAHIVDVSLGGLFIKTEAPCQRASVLTLNFELPNNPDPVACSAKVIYTHNNIPAGFRELILPGMGIEFVDISAEDRQKLDDFLHQG